MQPPSEEQIEPHFHLWTRYKALRTQFMRLRNLYLLVECAWCKTRMGWKRKHASVPGDTSHSVCTSCAAALRSELATLPSTLSLSVTMLWDLALVSGA